MALIGKIRNNMWFVFVLIGLATLAFILMDAMGPGGGGGVSPSTPVGTVGSEKIKQLDFEKSYQSLFANAQNPHASRAQLWNFFVEKAIIDQQAEDLGMSVGKDELFDLQFGQNLSPIIYQNFTNPNTGQLDVNQLGQIRQAIESNTFTNPSMRQYWAEQEKQIIKTQLQTKLTSTVQKSLYTPNWLAEMTYAEENGTADIAVVKIPFDNIPAGDITVTDADVDQYIKAHQSEFINKEEKRIVQFVSYDVIPSTADTLTWKNKINAVIDGFRTTDKDSSYAIANGGFYQPYFARAEEIEESYAERLPTYEVGEVYGPYELFNSYQAVKLIDKQIIPDSVKAAHILRNAVPGNITQLAEAERIIDSLYAVLQKDKSKFDQFAKDFSQDQSSAATGGDLGTFVQGAMVKSFNDVCFLTGKSDNIYKVKTQFGVHLVYVKDQVFNSREPKYQLAYVNVPIIPTKDTEDEGYQVMLNLISSYPYLDGLTEAINANPKLKLESSNQLAANDYIVANLTSGNTSREIVKWAFEKETAVNEVSPNVYSYNDPIRYYTNRYVIAGLSSIIKPGLPSGKALRNQLEFTVLNELKAEKAKAAINSKDLNSIANQYNVSVDTINSLNLLNTFVAGLGNEPAVIGAAFGLDNGAVSGPIIGNSGVFVVKTLAKTTAGNPSNIAFLKRTVSGRSRISAPTALMESLKSEVKIKDNRSKFY
jgi:peptidyl-prolyl cis-trans isomerase D